MMVPGSLLKSQGAAGMGWPAIQSNQPAPNLVPGASARMQMYDRLRWGQQPADANNMLGRPANPFRKSSWMQQEDAKL